MMRKLVSGCFCLRCYKPIPVLFPYSWKEYTITIHKNNFRSKFCLKGCFYNKPNFLKWHFHPAYFFRLTLKYKIFQIKCEIKKTPNVTNSLACGKRKLLQNNKNVIWTLADTHTVFVWIKHRSQIWVSENFKNQSLLVF